MARPKKFDQSATLQKALNVFWRKGYAGTSMADLVAAMGINAPSLYDTYGDKRQLFLSALRSYQQSQRVWMKNLLGTAQPARESIRQLLEALVEDSLTDPDRKGCFMVNTTTELANRDEEVFGVVVDNERSVRGLLTELIEKGKQSGEFAPDKDPELVATYLFTLIQGLRLMAATNPNRHLLRGTMEVAISAL